MSKVLVIGGGAAGMFAAIFAAYNGNEVHLFEKNEKLGKKIYITGKGRCNITNASDMETLFQSVVTNSKFLYSSFYGYTNQDTIDFFERIGVKTKIERGNRVFPVSDHSSDVIAGLTRELRNLGVEIHLYSEVVKVVGKEKFEYIELKNGQKVKGDACIVATGGFSYQTTGSTGDGYRFAKECGHTVTDCYPSLVAIRLKEGFIGELQGLSLKNVTLTLKQGKKTLYEDMGEMLFTADGISGPLVLSASSYLAGKLEKGESTVQLDLKPAMTFKSKFAQIKTIKKGEGISYDYSYIADKDMKVGTVLCGYSDGIPRILSNKGDVYVNGKKANILGKICMDQCIVDLTDIKDVSMDSEVIFYGNGGPNLLDVANLADTNRNELLSIVSRRVARVYIKDKKIYKILDYLNS